MKPCLLLLCSLFFASVQVQAQSVVDTVTYLRNIPAEGVLLDKGWKYRAGDNPEWARPEFDDTQWQPVDPTLDVYKLQQTLKEGIGWFRLHLSVDSTVREQQLALIVQQSGASEIYLNGQRIHSFGSLHKDPDKVKAFSPKDKPVPFPISGARRQVLAVRYALQPHITYSANWNTSNSGFMFSVNTLENANEKYYSGRIHEKMALISRVGMFGILGILYFTFYLFYSVQKVNLHFSLYALLQVAAWGGFLYNHGQHHVEDWYLINNLLLILQVVSFFFLLLATYRLMEQKREWAFYLLVLLGIISIPAGAFIYGWGWLVFGILFTNLVNFEITRVAFVAVKIRKKGAWIIATGGVGFLLFWLLFTMQNIGYGYLKEVPVNFFSIAIVCIPVAVSIYLGYDFALTNRYLRQKLTEVERLSDEKQLILSTQNETLEKQVAERTHELSLSLKELKATQAQLIQKEKMASLGELTAGVAHEIQNPLNFINNFSEVSVELCTEIEDEAKAGEHEVVLTITADLKQNLQIIHHHGRRADSIVKNMLQHSRTSAGEKQLTNLNALAEEYLRLSYSGIRAKEKNFQCTLDTSYDQSLKKAEVVPQELGRVLLNLFNNAFYAVQQKQKLRLAGHEPKVAVSTVSRNGKAEIRVWDNGTGIPEGVKHKIFQPFLEPDWGFPFPMTSSQRGMEASYP